MHAERFAAIADEAARGALLCELNVVEQVVHVCQTTVVADAWQRGQDLTVHGCIYGLHDGRLRDLQLSVTRGTDLGAAYAGAVDSLVRAARIPDSGEKG
jgi:carbonic anhydrase